METFFKDYFWVVNLTALLIAGYLTAQTTNEVLGEKLFGTEAFAPLETASDSALAVTVTPRQGRNRRYADTLFTRNIFNADRVDREPEPPSDYPDEPPEEKEEEDPDGEIQDSELNATLIGTMVAPNPAMSMATLQLEGKSQLIQIGTELKRNPDDTVILATVEDIQRRVVLVREAGELRRIRLWGDPKAQPAAGEPGRMIPARPPVGRAPQPPTARPGTDFSEGVKKVSMYSYDVDRRMLEEQLSDLSQLGREARVVPNYRDGQYQGFKLIGVRPGSMYRALGIRSGDIIQRVNGEDISSPNKAIQLFEKLRTQNQIEIDIERRGQQRTLSYSIK